MGEDALTVAPAEGRIAALYRLHMPAARRLAYLLTGDLASAEDLAHDAFLKVVGRLADLRSPDAFAPYLKRAVVNASRSAHRHREVNERHAPTLARSEAVAGPNIDERDAMWRLLQRLPERQRAALVLRYYEDLSESQTADILRCRPGTVKSLVSRGLEAMRKEMQS
ncbi:MAG: SigE family RNA polymerase sigma factor [Actinomycetota bacterium]